MKVGTNLFKKDTAPTKNPKHIKRNVFIIYPPRHIKFEPATFRRIDTEIQVFLPDNSRRFISSRVNGDELKEVFDEGHRLWIKILNRSFEDNIIKKNKPLGFIVTEPENLKFVYTGRDVVNQVGKIAPGIIKDATDKISSIAEQRLNQLISQGGKEVERVEPNVVREALEDVYQTPIRLLANFGKNQFNKLKRKISKS